MAANGEQPGRQRPVVGADLIIPIAAIALALYYFTTIIDSPWTAQVTAFFVGAILILLSLLLIGRSLWRFRQGDVDFSLDELIQPVAMLPVRAALLALVIASLYFISILGFTLTAILFLSSAMLLLNRGKNPVRIIVLAVTLSIVWFILFVLIFQRRFPLGWLDHQITGFVKPMLQSLGLG